MTTSVYYTHNDRGLREYSFDAINEAENRAALYDEASSQCRTSRNVNYAKAIALAIAPLAVAYFTVKLVLALSLAKMVVLVGTGAFLANRLYKAHADKVTVYVNTFLKQVNNFYVTGDYYNTQARDIDLLKTSGFPRPVYSTPASTMEGNPLSEPE